MHRNRFGRWALMAACLVVSVAADSSIDYAQLISMQEKVEDACPVRWEGHLAKIDYQAGDSLWQGDLRDKAAFVKYASTHLKDIDGSFLISGFNDDGAIIISCGEAKLELFALMRQDQLNVSNAFDLDTLLDTDNDGVNDALDICPDSSDSAIPEGQTYSVNAVGCTPWQADTDEDGVTDHIDQCPSSQAGVTVDSSNGCLDSDQDGISDENDPYPFQHDTLCQDQGAL